MPTSARHSRPFSCRLSAVSRAQSRVKTAKQKSPLKNGENGNNGRPSQTMSRRDSRGRFTKGNAGGPGRPRKPTRTAYHNALMDVIPIDGWEQVVTRALEDAQAGDKHARRWLSDYVVGHPVTPSIVDGIPVSMLERLIRLLRATGHEPEQVFESLIFRLEREQEAQHHERRHDDR